MDKEALAQRIKDACESSGEVEFRNDYTGRGMYGRQCVGIVSTTRECNKVIAAVINALMSSVSARALEGDSYKLTDAEQEFEQSVELLLDNQQDSMGYGVIIYWESLAPLEEEEELDSDGQPDEAQEWHDFDPDC